MTRHRFVIVMASLLSLCASRAGAQVCQDFVVDLGATVSTNPAQIELNWSLRLTANITSQTLYRRLKGESSWTVTNALTTNTTSFVDSSVSEGIEYEYWLARKLNVYAGRADGYLIAGVNVPFVEDRGKLILIVDDSMTNALAPELSQLQQDLVGDGWSVIRHDVPRMTVAPSETNSIFWATRSNELAYVKSLIVSNYNADPANVKAVYLLGRTPVPYSGSIAPDGHGDHYGAWPALGFYGDINGNWTDTSITSTNGSDRRNWNQPGDGKFDQSSIPSDLELQVGRVDMANMTKFPTAAVTETNLLRRYLHKAHEYRHCEGVYGNIERRAMLRDGFGYFSGERFAASGWGAIYSAIGRTSTAWDAISSGEWFIRPETSTYLFAYGNGGGNYEGASTVGSSADFGDKPSRAVFTSLFGSYFGDWDRANVFLRAPLAGNARGNSYGLTCFWSGRPSWFLHHMGMGETIGYAARLSQNNSSSGYQYYGSSTRGVHVGLVGDPALRFYAVPPPKNLTAVNSSGAVRLNWSLMTGVMGYHVFRADSPNVPFTRLTTNFLRYGLTFFVDDTVTAGSTYTYMVRVLKLETVPGGTFQNLSQGAFVTFTAGSSAPRNPTSLQVTIPAATEIVLNWKDNANNETGYRIERRDGPGANFVAIATVSANTNTFTDTGPLPAGAIFYYRVIATGDTGDSAPSNEVYADGNTGFLELPTSILHVDKSAGNAVISLTRYGGSNGAVSVLCYTTNISAFAGTHYTGFSNTMTFADGDITQQTINVPLLDIGQPQLPRSFKLIAKTPTGGASVALGTNTLVLIEDATATLAPPWQQTIVGAPTDYGPAVSAEGVIGSSIYGGGISTDDELRFIYQVMTNNVLLTAKVEAPLPVQTTARYGLMMRSNLASTATMALLWLPGDNSGAKLGYRSASGGSVTYLPSTSNTNKAPYWLRLARLGNNFLAETSSNGVHWLALTNITQTAPSVCYWGLFHYSDPNLRDFQLATFRNVSITTNVLPVVPANLAAAPAATNRVNLSWTDPGNSADNFSIQRRPLSGTFDTIAGTVSNITAYTDATALAGTTYEYRVCATNSWGVSEYSAIATAATYSAYQQWCADNGLPTDGSGNGASTATPAGDGIPNLMKHALGLHAMTNGYQGHLLTSTTNLSGQTYLTLTYTRPEPAPPGLTYAVEVANDLVVPDWTSAETVVVSNTVNGSWRTITVRDQHPVADRPKRFIHLRVTQ
ncbi:MAG: hypothetical protein FJ395_10645 [Verrucomicrobia bacterium]|nr:hypothetical protein [Verrucomicrobiota bacterium]